MKKVSEKAEEVVYLTRRRVEGVVCDVCDKLVLPSRFRSKDSRYFEVTTGHKDWGNGSYESIKLLDVCPSCINNFISEYMNGVNGTEYLSLATKYVWEGEYCEYE